jgi:hypothetical protein
MEIGIRLFVPLVYWPSRDPMEDWQLDRVLGWVQKPNMDVTERTEYGWVVRFRTNRDGCTPGDATRQRTPGKMRIMIFGDSTVVGRSVPQDQTVSAQLTAMLRKKGLNVEVINAGVQGYGTDQSLLRMEQLLPLYHPDMVIYGLCQNNFGHNQLSENHYQAKPIFKMTPEGEFKMIPPALKDKIYLADYGPRQFIREMALYRLLRPAIFQLRQTIGKLDDKRTIISLDEFYYDPQALDKKVDWKLFRYLVSRMNKVSKANGACFWFYAHPALQEVWGPSIKKLQQSLGLNPGQYDRYAVENRLKKIAGEDGLVFVPIIDYFRQHESEGPFHLLPLDPHCNQTGYKLIAQVLCNCCAKLLTE